MVLRGKLFQLRERASHIVAEAATQAVDAHFFYQSVAGVVAEAVGLAVFVNQLGQALGLIVQVMYLLAAGVFAASGQAACVALKVGGVAVAAGVADDLAEGVVDVA